MFANKWVDNWALYLPYTSPDPILWLHVSAIAIFDFRCALYRSDGFWLSYYFELSILFVCRHAARQPKQKRWWKRRNKNCQPNAGSGQNQNEKLRDFNKWNDFDLSKHKQSMIASEKCEMQTLQNVWQNDTIASKYLQLTGCSDLEFTSIDEICYNGNDSSGKKCAQNAYTITARDTCREREWARAG